MKVTALVAAAVLACSGAALAQQRDAPQPRSDETARASEMQHAPASPRMREGARRVGEKTRNLARRATDKVRQVARGDRREAPRASDTRAMGAPGAPAAADSDAARRARMDAAYANYRSKQDPQRR